MEIKNLILKKYRDKAINNKGEWLFSHYDALKIINECEKMKIVILGMDFWQHRNNSFVQTNSTNFDSFNTGSDASKNTVLASRKLIEKELPDSAELLSFILGNPDNS